MTKLLLASALLAGTFAFAEQKKYEISPMIGYNYHESNLGLQDRGYLIGGLELQVNDFASVIKPEFSIFYSPGVDYSTGATTDVVRFAVNGVYALDSIGIFAPFVKAGLGVENITTRTTQNKSGPFVDVGTGAKINFTESLALKIEAMYLGKIAQHNDGNMDHNLIALIGFTYSFGETEQKTAVKQVAEPVVVAAPVIIDGDDDKDGVLNSKDKCANSAAGIRVDTDGCFLDSDDDKDGVLNAADKCPSTPTGTKVDTKGCTIDNDIDKDGVLNAIDKCPDTLPGATVNNNGCAESAVLDVVFKNNSFEVLPESHSKIQKVADFLKRHTNYSAKIIGYTDSRGSAKYNQSISEKRANAVKELLIQKGAPAKNLSSLGRGEESPIADNMLKEGRAKNRRVEAEFTIN